MTASVRPVGTVVRDERGEWVIVALTHEPDVRPESRVRLGSLAHHVLAERDHRLAETLPGRADR